MRKESIQISSKIDEEKKILKEEQSIIENEINKYNKGIREYENELLLYKSKFKDEEEKSKFQVNVTIHLIDLLQNRILMRY